MPCPTLALSSGHQMPALGLGTWKSKPGEVRGAVEAAVRGGYTHVDCAHVYANEPEVGAALAACFTEGVAKREDVFVTSKLWNTSHAAECVLPALRLTLQNLQLDYLDLYLIHWPQGFQAGDDPFPKDGEGNFIFSDVSIEETWRELEKAVDAGLVRSIGLSNYNSKQIDEVLGFARVKPAVLQVEIHPYFSNAALVAHAQSRGLQVTAYSPFGSPDRPWATAEDVKVLDDPVLGALAAKHGKSPAQVVLRWLLQRNLIVIPKSVTPARILQNQEVFDFELSAEEMKEVDALNRNLRCCPVQACSKHPLYPFHEPY